MGLGRATFSGAKIGGIVSFFKVRVTVKVRVRVFKFNYFFPFPKMRFSRLLMLFLTNTCLWLANFWKILELEKAKQKVARSIIDDDLRVVSRRTDFDFEALSSEYYLSSICVLLIHYFHTIIYVCRRRGFK